MKIEPELSDVAILQEMGHRLHRQRLEQGLTQAELATEAGVSKRTVERIEAGESAQSATLVPVLRVLGLLEGLDQALPLPVPGPLDLLKTRGKVRQRATAKRPADKKDQPWTWGDER